MAHFKWVIRNEDEPERIIVYCTQAQMDEHFQTNAAFREARRIRSRREGSIGFITKWGFRKSFPYPMDDKSFGTLPKPLKFLGMNNIVVMPHRNGGISTMGLKAEYPEINNQKLEYNWFIDRRAPWKRMTEKKFLVVFRNLGYAPCDYRWKK